MPATNCVEANQALTPGRAEACICFDGLSLCCRLTTTARAQEDEMKALVLEAPRTLRLSERTPRAAGPGDVVVDVELTGIGGSEYLAFAAPGLRSLPNVMGHGIVGTSPDGQRVAINPLRGCGFCQFCAKGLRQLCEAWSLIGVQCDGGFAEQVTVPEESLVPLPAALTWEQAAFIEPFANSVNAWDQSQAGPAASIAVLGAGGLGLGLVARARAAGCSTIEVGEPSPTRREAARVLGATEASPRLEGHYDVVFDSVGSTESRQAALELTHRGGTCVLLGFASPSLELDAVKLIRHQKRLIGSFVYSAQQFRQAIDLAARTKDEWVRNLRFSEVDSLLTAYLDGDFSVVRAALKPKW